MKTNPMMEFIYKRKVDGEELTGVEIGVGPGLHAHQILHRLSMKKLYLIDPYLKYEEYNEAGIPSHSQEDFDKDYIDAKRELKKFADKVQFIRMKSHEAANIIPDNLDFCYIDGNHDYKYVKMDIERHYPKIKPGGVLGGHNYQRKFPGVIRAVSELITKMGLKLDGHRSYWWVVKPTHTPP